MSDVNDPDEDLSDKVTKIFRTTSHMPIKACFQRDKDDWHFCHAEIETQTSGTVPLGEWEFDKLYGLLRAIEELSA